MSQLLRHYGVSHHPFARNTPKDALLRHRGFEEALSRLRFTVELDSLALLVAKTGCGKSLLLGELNDELRLQGWAVHYLAHTTIGPFGLVNVLARKAGINPRRSRAETAMALTDTLMDNKCNNLLIIDEAHALPDSSLEDIRLLTIADFDRKSPFLLLLAGRPSLEERLAEPTHRALDQRITTVARLAPLSLDETRQYVAKRLAAAGGDKTPIFDDGAIEAIFDASGGVPRRINNFATGAMIVAAARGRRVVTAQDVNDARFDRGKPNMRDGYPDTQS
jgi:general secretion pathway protein A